MISEKPAWEVLRKWKTVIPEFAHYSFRQACGYTAHPNELKFKKWALEQTYYHADLFPTINRIEIHHLDWSVSSTWIGHLEDISNLELFQFKIDKLQKQVPNAILAGGYLEPRPIYTSAEYDKIGNYGRESRTIHLGIDYCLPENTPIHALFDGEVVIAAASGRPGFAGYAFGLSDEEVTAVRQPLADLPQTGKDGKAEFALELDA